MSAIFEDPKLGRLVFTDTVLANMHKHGLFRFEVLQALKQGFSVTPLIPGTLQRQHRPKRKYDVSVVYRTINQDGEPIGGAVIVTCWKRSSR